MDFEAVSEKLKDTLLVVTEIQRRQAKVQHIQPSEVDAIRKRFERIETNLAEATEKINALVATMDGLIRRDRPES